MVTSSAANRLALAVEMYLFQSRRPAVSLCGWVMSAMMTCGGDRWLYTHCHTTSVCDDGGGDGCTTTEELLVMLICGDADGDGCTPT